MKTGKLYKIKEIFRYAYSEENYENFRSLKVGEIILCLHTQSDSTKINKNVILSTVNNKADIRIVFSVKDNENRFFEEFRP